MSKTQYYQQLSSVIDNALLHLYCQIATTERFVPIAQRNTILNRFLKPKIKDLRYKTIKGDIKRMVQIGQRPGGNLEVKTATCGCDFPAVSSSNIIMSSESR